MASQVPPELLKKTQEILGRVIKKPPLTEKLLSRPPFRYLHDIISEVISSTGFGAGLYEDSDMNSENVKEKEAKVIYLTKIVDVVGISTGVEVKANPLKIVAGLDPDATNEFLILLGRAILKKVDSADAVQRVLNGEHQGVSSRQNSTSRINLTSAKSSSSVRKSSDSLRETGSGSKKPEARQLSNKRDESEPNADQVRSDVGRLGEEMGGQQSDGGSRENNQREVVKERERTSERERPNDAEGDESIKVEEKENREEPRSDAAAISGRPSMMPRKLTRPTTARLPPPRPKQNAATEELPATVVNIITDEAVGQDDDDEFQVKLHDSTEQNDTENVKPEQDLSKESHGGLVRKILQTKQDLEGQKEQVDDKGAAVLSGKEKVAAHKEMVTLRETIQSLVKSTNPLGKTMDYIQEDLDAMQKELEFWKGEGAQWKGKNADELALSKDSLLPLEKKLKEVENSIQEQVEKITNTKATIIQNDILIGKLLKNITQPVK